MAQPPAAPREDAPGWRGGPDARDPSERPDRPDRALRADRPQRGDRREGEAEGRGRIPDRETLHREFMAFLKDRGYDLPAPGGRFENRPDAGSADHPRGSALGEGGPRGHGARMRDDGPGTQGGGRRARGDEPRAQWGPGHIRPPGPTGPPLAGGGFGLRGGRAGPGQVGDRGQLDSPGPRGGPMGGGPRFAPREHRAEGPMAGPRGGPGQFGPRQGAPHGMSRSGRDIERHGPGGPASPGGPRMNDRGRMGRGFGPPPPMRQGQRFKRDGGGPPPHAPRMDDNRHGERHERGPRGE